jgi:succinate dehydrogenase flavin-adding protein (antitoxin of CptAB toxin-antitoxin module)
MMNKDWLANVLWAELATRGIWSNVGPLTLSGRISTVVEFIDECRLTHPNCWMQIHSQRVLPSRFIDVGSENRGIEPRLVSSRQIGMVEKYTTLSHCWGPNPENMPLRTLRATERAHKVSIPMASLPKTFRDAISVTRALDIQYIWIDSLCIVQDDSQDWEQEAAKMASIYEGSYLTIAAVDSPNSDGGLYLDSITPPAHFTFTAQSPRGTSDGSNNKESTAHVRELIQPGSNEDKIHLHNAPLYQRGWVFQELMLSPRSLHFRKHQLYWRCRRGLRSEDGMLDESKQNNLFQSIFTRSDGSLDDFSSLKPSTETWWSWVNNYTTRHLTRAEDRTAAMTGMIRYYERLTDDVPILGLWEKSFVCDLHWMVHSKSKGDKHAPLTGPSWSWLSHPKKGIFNQKYRDWFERGKNELEAQLESFDVQWSGSPFTSRLVSSKLYVSGVIRSFRITNPRWEHGYHAIHPLLARNITEEIECTLDDGSEIYEGLYITCLFLFYYAEHDEVEDADGYSQGEAHRNEYFLIISPHSSSGSSASDLVAISDSNEVTPRAYQRLGVGHFKPQMVAKDEWRGLTKRPYSDISWPNPELMFGGAQRVTIELV